VVSESTILTERGPASPGNMISIIKPPGGTHKVASTGIWKPRLALQVHGVVLGADPLGMIAALLDDDVGRARQ
jgi:hypothetical protein